MVCKGQEGIRWAGLWYLPQVGYPFCHASDASNDVAMGDHDALGYASGAAGVHDDSDVRGQGLPACHRHYTATEREREEAG